MGLIMYIRHLLLSVFLIIILAGCQAPTPRADRCEKLWKEMGSSEEDAAVQCLELRWQEEAQW